MIRFRRTWRRPGPEGVVPHLMADVVRRAREVSDLDVTMWRCVAGDNADLYRLSATARDPDDIADLVSAFGSDADLRNLCAEIGTGADTSDHHDHVLVAARRTPRPGTIIAAATIQVSAPRTAAIWADAVDSAMVAGATAELCAIDDRDGASIELVMPVAHSGIRPTAPSDAVAALRWASAVSHAPIGAHRWWRRSV